MIGGFSQGCATAFALGLDVTCRETPMPHATDPRLVPEMGGWVDARTAAATVSGEQP